ncbi:MAG: UvrD-helicase domain-containing protein [Halomonas sp.]|nr:UvrD-helicase domain-containing protein [Halomonas sp.]MCC5902740.1 UvrD-helicase domain-containing protein [Halomonas sp.]
MGEKVIKEWRPSWLGRQITRTPSWRLCLDGLEVLLTISGQTYRINVEDKTTYRIHAGMFWTVITLFPERGGTIKVSGLPNVQGMTLDQALKVAQSEKRIHAEVSLLLNVQRTIDQWLKYKNTQEKICVEERRWFTHEMQATVLSTRPTVDVNAIRERLKKTAVAVRLGPAAKAIECSLAEWEANHSRRWATLNLIHTERELKSCKELFDRVESKPLTKEQAEAVICFDNRVQVVASAGSGKTSTMVAKAAYAIYRGFVAPDRIVLLAFNKQAAEELKERAAKSLGRLGMRGVTLEATTFHALGLNIIGKATGVKPDIPGWATDTKGGLCKLVELINQLKKCSSAFQAQWDFFRFVFNKDLPIVDQGTWGKEGNSRLRSSQGELMKSQEEVMLANWLFYNGVQYRYEDNYNYKTVNKDYRQYKPDFYYPEIDLYHEHFALDAQGQPPPHFENYLEGVQWKRLKHKEMGTTLFETTSYGLRSGNDFQRLEAELIARGVVLNPNADRKIPIGGQQPIEPIELAELIRVFIIHAKSNCLTISALRQRLNAMPEGAFKYRQQLFLDIVEPIIEAWDAALVSDGGIDFEDMLNLATEHLESGRYESPFDLVMVDEFQDTSRARARLCRAMTQKAGRFLFAVGDDWQSINRFAGADVSVMTNFRQWFGYGHILKLEQTFRCPQMLCDVSSWFISKNPNQIAKKVYSTTPVQGPVLQAFQVDSKEKLIGAIDQFVMGLAEKVQSGAISSSRNGKISVYVLGRYNTDRQYVPSRKFRFENWVDVSFLTIHRSKGSEADYIILPEMLSTIYGRSFPNTRTDDSVLALAMPSSDNFPMSEERRLFYVALTRARRSVAMFTVQGQYSTFLQELAADHALAITNTDGRIIHLERCPACKQGVLVKRTGPYGEFCSCSNYPVCGYKPTHHILSPLQQHASRSTGTMMNRPSPVPTPEPKNKNTQRHTLSSLFRSINNGLSDFNRILNHRFEIQSATSELERRIYAEREIIEASLRLARSDVELEGQLKNPVYNEAYMWIREVINSQQDEPQDENEHIAKLIPAFERLKPHMNPEIESAIKSRMDILREDREVFLSEVRVQLDNAPAIRNYFIKRLAELHGTHYLSVLDPHGAWRR